MNDKYYIEGEDGRVLWDLYPDAPTWGRNDPLNRLYFTDEAKARKVAKEIGAHVVRFNPDETVYKPEQLCREAAQEKARELIEFCKIQAGSAAVEMTPTIEAALTHYAEAGAAAALAALKKHKVL